MIRDHLSEEKLKTALLYPVSKYIDEKHSANIKSHSKWVNEVMNKYEELRANYRSCFEKKLANSEQPILDEHKALSCWLMAIQSVEYPIKTQTHRYRHEKMMLYIMEEFMRIFADHLNQKNYHKVYEKISKSNFKYPESVTGGDYDKQFIQSLYYAKLNRNCDIFSLSNIIFLLESYNYAFYKEQLK